MRRQKPLKGAGMPNKARHAHIRSWTPNKALQVRVRRHTPAFGALRLMWASDTLFWVLAKMELDLNYKSSVGLIRSL